MPNEANRGGRKTKIITEDPPNANYVIKQANKQYIGPLYGTHHQPWHKIQIKEIRLDNHSPKTGVIKELSTFMKVTVSDIFKQLICIGVYKIIYQQIHKKGNRPFLSMDVGEHRFLQTPHSDVAIVSFQPKGADIMVLLPPSKPDVTVNHCEIVQQHLHIPTHIHAHTHNIHACTHTHGSSI